MGLPVLPMMFFRLPGCVYNNSIMARVHKNPLLKGVRGKIGDSIVVKQYKYGTVISAVPDMSRVKRTVLQKKEQM
jgi:hypothetical protein